MTPGRLYILIATLTVCLFLTEARAETDPVSHATQLYAQGDYLSAIDYIESMISDTLGLGKKDRASLIKVLGSAYVAVGNLESAKKQFEALLEADSTVDFDPVATSPKILSVFREVKKEFDAAHAVKTPPETLATPLPPSQPEPSVWVTPALKSLLLPGFGQMQNGDNRKAYVFVYSEVASLAGLLVSQIKCDDARREYMANRDITHMDALYDNYDKWYMLRNALITSSIGISVVSSVDAIVGSFGKKDRQSRTSVGFLPLQDGLYAYIEF